MESKSIGQLPLKTRPKKIRQTTSQSSYGDYFTIVKEHSVDDVRVFDMSKPHTISHMLEQFSRAKACLYRS